MLTYEGVGNNMQLQPNAEPCERLWGYAKSEEAVVVAFLGREYRTVASRAPRNHRRCFTRTIVQILTLSGAGISNSSFTRAQKPPQVLYSYNSTNTDAFWGGNIEQ
jgi:hypothetical protein